MDLQWEQGKQSTLNMAHVRTIFYGPTAIEKLILPLHPDKRTITLTEKPKYKMAFNFLTEIVLKAFTSNQNGEYLATTLDTISTLVI